MHPPSFPSLGKSSAPLPQSKISSTLIQGGIEHTVFHTLPRNAFSGNLRIDVFDTVYSKKKNRPDLRF